MQRGSDDDEVEQEEEGCRLPGNQEDDWNRRYQSNLCPLLRLQAFVVKRLLEYTQQEESDLAYGMLLVLGLLVMELMRSWSLALTWALNYRTGTRLRGAILSLAFEKILLLRSVRDKSVGQVCSDLMVLAAEPAERFTT